MKEMKINLWYSRGCQRSWTLMDDFQGFLGSGNAPELDKAMEDLATTIKWLGDAQPRWDKEHPATTKLKSQQTTMYREVP